MTRQFELGVQLAFGRFVIDATSGEVVISPDTGRMESPTNKGSVRELLGLMRNLEARCPDITAKSNLLRVLANRDTRFLWTEDHESIFQRLKETVADVYVLSAFDPALPLHLMCNASWEGGWAMCCCSLQRGELMFYSAGHLPCQQPAGL